MSPSNAIIFSFALGLASGVSLAVMLSLTRKKCNHPGHQGEGTYVSESDYLNKVEDIRNLENHITTEWLTIFNINKQFLKLYLETEQTLNTSVRTCGDLGEQLLRRGITLPVLASFTDRFSAGLIRKPIGMISQEERNPLKHGTTACPGGTCRPNKPAPSDIVIKKENQ